MKLHQAEQVETVQAGHLNVQKHNVWRVPLQLQQRFGAIGCKRADGKLGPQCNETFAKFLAKVKPAAIIS